MLPVSPLLIALQGYQSKTPLINKSLSVVRALPLNTMESKPKESLQHGRKDQNKELRGSGQSIK